MKLSEKVPASSATCSAHGGAVRQGNQRRVVKRAPREWVRRRRASSEDGAGGRATFDRRRIAGKVRRAEHHLLDPLVSPVPTAAGSRPGREIVVPPTGRLDPIPPSSLGTGI